MQRVHIRAKKLSKLYVKRSSLWSTRIYREYQCGSLKRIVVLPLSLFFLFFYFLWPQWLFLFNSHLSTLGSFDFVLFGSFPHFRGNTLLFTRIQEIFHTLQRYSHKENVTIMKYANVCLCQGSRICNDTSASCSNDQGKAQLACGSSIKQVACMT